MGKFPPSPKIYPKKKVAEKRFLSFLPALPKKGKAGSEHRQGKTADRLAEVRAQRRLGGGEEIRLLCPTKFLTSFIKGRGGRDRVKNNSFPKEFVQRTLNKNRFFARTRTQDYRR